MTEIQLPAIPKHEDNQVVGVMVYSGVSHTGEHSNSTQATLMTQEVSNTDLFGIVSCEILIRRP